LGLFYELIISYTLKNNYMHKRFLAAIAK